MNSRSDLSPRAVGDNQAFKFGGRIAALVASFFQVAALLLSNTSGSAAAESDIARIRQDIVGSWLVDIQGETRSRTLNVVGIESVSPGEFALEVTYGWSDAKQTSVKAHLQSRTGGYRLTLKTQADSVLDAESADASSFIGTFRWKTGKEVPARLERMSKGKLDDLVAASRSSAFVVPGANVPATCASFVGGWRGNWSQGYHADEWLWIVEVNEKCVVRYTFGQGGFPGPFDVGEIRDGVFVVPKKSGGEISLVRRGDDIWGRYSGIDGSNSLHLRPVPLKAR